MADNVRVGVTFEQAKLAWETYRDRAERIESAARDVIADYECGFSANNAIIALKRALEPK